MLKKRLSVRVDEKTLQKLRVIAKCEIRSVNSQIVTVIRECIERFEAEHGEIKQ